MFDDLVSEPASRSARRVVISQPMFFPWVGMLEQLRLADVFIDYDDVQFSKGSFTNRVQIKTARGSSWMTVPLANLHLGQTIADVRTNESEPWRARHLAVLEQAYATAPHKAEMLALVRSVYALPTDSLASIATASVLALARYFDVMPPSVHTASALPVRGHGADRVLELVRYFGGKAYVTGHGAKNYLDHGAFEARSIDVRYMRYRMDPYLQQHGPFTPFVSALDLVANLGKSGRALIRSETVSFREFLSS